jgi:hypothetical protein
MNAALGARTELQVEGIEKRVCRRSQAIEMPAKMLNNLVPQAPADGIVDNS